MMGVQRIVSPCVHCGKDTIHEACPEPVVCWDCQQRIAALYVIALRNLTRRETVKCNAHQGYTKDFHVLQYQTNDGVWHDLPDAFEEIL